MYPIPTLKLFKSWWNFPQKNNSHQRVIQSKDFSHTKLTKVVKACAKGACFKFRSKQTIIVTRA